MRRRVMTPMFFKILLVFCFSKETCKKQHFFLVQILDKKVWCFTIIASTKMNLKLIDTRNSTADNRNSKAD